MSSKTVEFEKYACPLGCKPDDDLVLKGRDRLHKLPGEFSVVICRNCGLMRTDPRPTPESIKFYYPDSYGPFVPAEPKNLVERKGLLYRTGKWLFRLLVGDLNINPIPPMKSGRMLEIGCGTGSYLHSMALKGWQVHGIEVSPLAGEIARSHGHPVDIRNIESVPNPQEPFDLIVGWHVLEHLHQPVGTLKRMREWIKPTGSLVLAFPNMGSIEFKIFKDRWYPLSLPTHLFHFTPDTIKKVLKSAGWKVEKIFYQKCFTDIIASIVFVLEDYLGETSALTQYFLNLHKNGSHSLLILYPFARLLACFHQTSRMTVWAKKVDQ